MERMSGFTKALLAVAIIGAINWGLVGFFNWNLVDAIFGGGAREETSTFSRFIYALVGLAGLASLPMLFGRRAGFRRHATT
jgi:uncharacterized membrane protein YuzA (DUF378 family)